MSEKPAPEIKPINEITYEVKQSKYENVPKLPIRGYLVAPSSGGKSTLLVNKILNIYRDCFDRIYVFSPSVELDTIWQPVKEYVEKHFDMTDKEPKAFYDEYDQES